MTIDAVGLADASSVQAVGGSYAGGGQGLPPVPTGYAQPRCINIGRFRFSLAVGPSDGVSVVSRCHISRPTVHIS